MNSELRGGVALSYPAEQRPGFGLLNERVDQPVTVDTEQCQIGAAVVGMTPVEVQMVNHCPALAVVPRANLAAPFLLVPQTSGVGSVAREDGPSPLLVAGHTARLLAFVARRRLAMLFSVVQAHRTRRRLDRLVTPAAQSLSRPSNSLFSALLGKTVKAYLAVRTTRHLIATAQPALAALCSQDLVDGNVRQAKLSGSSSGVAKAGVSLGHGILVGHTASGYVSQFTWRSRP